MLREEVSQRREGGREGRPDAPATGGLVLLHLEVVERHTEVAEEGVAELLQLAEGLCLHLLELLIVFPLQPRPGEVREERRGERRTDMVSWPRGKEGSSSITLFISERASSYFSSDSRAWLLRTRTLR
jgi:hypothetical protein